MRQNGKSIRESVNRAGWDRGWWRVENGEVYSSYGWLHLHILLQIVARLAANRKMRHRQQVDRDGSRKKEREREVGNKREIDSVCVMARVVFACLICFELAAVAARKYVCQMLNQPHIHTHTHTHTHTTYTIWQTNKAN